MLHKGTYDIRARQRWIIVLVLAVVSISTLWVGLTMGLPAVVAGPSFTPDFDLASVGGPSLDIEDLVEARAGGTATVTVSFAAGGSLISATLFSLDFDESLLTFDPTDADSDGIPDSVTFGVPPAFRGSVTYDAADTDGELDFLIADIFPPVVALTDGVIVSVTFGVGSPGSTTEAAVNCSLDPKPTFGSTVGASVRGTCSDGSVLIQVSPVTRTLDVSIAGSGGGTVTSAPPGINCSHRLTSSRDCTEVYDLATTVTLTATPGTGSVFAGWSGDCAGTGSCVLTMDTDKKVTANFLMPTTTPTPAPTPIPHTITPTPPPTAHPVGADLSITQTASPDPVAIGESLTYTMTVVNNGPNPATAVVLTHTLKGPPLSPSQMSLQSAPASCDKSGNTSTCSLGTLASGERLVIFTSVTPKTLGMITSTASVISDVRDPNPSNNDIMVATKVLPGVRPLAPSTVLQGSTFDVVVKAGDMGVTDLAGAQFHLNYDRHWLTPILPATPGPDFAGCFTLANDTAGNEPPPLSHAVVTALACTAGRSGAPLTLWTIAFHAAAVLESINTELQVTQTLLKDSEQLTIPSVGTKTSVAIAPGVCGDAAFPHDGVVDVGDAIFVLQIIVKLIEPTSLQLILGDVSAGPTGDGLIDVGDAMLMLQHITEMSKIGGCGPP